MALMMLFFFFFFLRFARLIIDQLTNVHIHTYTCMCANITCSTVFNLYYVCTYTYEKKRREAERESEDYAHQRRRQSRREARLWFFLFLCTGKRFTCKLNERKHIYAKNRRRGAEKARVNSCCNATSTLTTLMGCVCQHM